MSDLLSYVVALLHPRGKGRGPNIFSRPMIASLALLAQALLYAGFAAGQGQAPEPPFDLSGTVVNGEVRLLWKNPTAAKDLKIAFMGSSTTAGEGASPGMSYVDVVRRYYLSTYPKYVSVNTAVGGYTSYSLVPTGSVVPPNRPGPDTLRNITAVLKTNPQIVVVNLPSNDVANGYSSQEFIDNLKAIRAAAQAAGVPIFFTTTQPRNFNHQGARERLREQAALIRDAFAPMVIDIYDELADPVSLNIKPEYNSGDGVHLNNAGHAFIASTLVGVVDAFLSSTLFPGAAGITAIEVYRAQGSGQLTYLAQVGGTSTSYTDNAVSGGTTYRYALKAVKNGLRSAFSNEVTVTTPGIPPSIASFTPATGRVGTAVTISGSEFSSATAVRFNGLSASFTVLSNTRIEAIVPAGATTGPITVTTPFGLATSGSSFTLTAESPFVYEWRPKDKAVTAVWTEQDNWSPARVKPSPKDVLLFNQGDSTVATNVPNESVAQMVVSKGTVITLVPQRQNTLTLTGGESGAALEVGINSALRLHAQSTNRSLSIHFPVGSKGLISGRVVFTSENGGSNIPHRLLAEEPEAITFLGNSKFVAESFTGNPFGNSGTPNTVVFRPGSTYVAQAGGNPFGLNQPASKVVFDRQSIFLLQHTADPSFAGRTYGDLIVDLSLVADRREIRVGVGSQPLHPFTVNNFSILNGRVSFPLRTNNQPLPVQLLGSLTVAAGATLDFSPVASAAASVFSFAGDTAPVIGGQGDIIFGRNTTLQINTPLDQDGVSRVPVALNRSLTLAGNLDLAQGVLIIPSLSHTLTIASGQTVSGGNANSFVEGNLARSVSRNAPASLYFPVGSINRDEGQLVFRPLTLEVTSSQATAFTVRQIEGPPATRNLPFQDNGGATIDRVSDVRYYAILKQNEAAQVRTGSITLSFGADDGVSDPANLRIATGNAAQWVDLGGTATVNGSSPFQGTITAPLPDNPSFGDFVLANASGGQNPLPVELIRFSATQAQEGVLLRWSTAMERNNRGFDIERSPDGTGWERIGFLAGHGNSQKIQDYLFTDQKAPGLQMLYYRLKQLDEDGTYAYSRIVAIQLNTGKKEIVLYPNPVINEMHLRLGAQAGDVRLRVTNALGQILSNKTYTDGQTEIVENLSHLPSGIYQVEISVGPDRTIRKFVKAAP